MSSGTQTTELRVPSVLYVSRTCPLHQSERKYFVQIGEPICRVTTLTSGIWPLFDETWLYFAEKSPARRLIFSKFRKGARQTSVRRLVGALLTSRFPLSDCEAGESSVSFSSQRCPHTGPQCGPAEIHGCFILGVLRGFPEKMLSIRQFSAGL